ncbi:MAG: VOC family protein [Acidimicrobiia bacterium]|nr:VOC family protein [Acidimicrobiia bacterium]
MTVTLNHTIVGAQDPEATATFFTEVLGLAPAKHFGPFHVVEVGNGVSLDVAGSTGDVAPQHYAFLVDETEFDQIYGRIRERDLDHWADPRQSRPGEVNHNHGGRGVYFLDPNGHYLEILTVPYGGWS